MSNPDLLRDNSTTAGQGPAVESDQRTEYPEHVLKVYKSDQVNICYIVPNPSTNLVLLSFLCLSYYSDSAGFLKRLLHANGLL